MPRFTSPFRRVPFLPQHARGMSLIEVIIVIVLIGAVLTFLANRVLGGADKAKVNLARAQVQSLASKIEQYELDNNGLPPDLDALVNAPQNSPNWLGPYAKSDEIKDPWGRPFIYRVPGENGAYDLLSYGKDGQPGGESVNGDIRLQ